MLDLATLFFTTLLVNNLVLTQFLGLCPFVGVSSSLSASLGMGLATTLVISIAASTGFVLTEYLLLPLDALYLQPLFSILLIALLVQTLEMLIKIASPLLFHALGIYLPLITSNCAVLGVALLVTRKHNNLLDAFWYGLAAGLGFTMTLLLFAALREKLQWCDVPYLFRSLPVTVLSMAISSLAFMGFVGI